jgi:hypothetical protein
VRVLDQKNEYPDANLSGLDVAGGTLWAVENGRGRLHRHRPQGDAWAGAGMGRRQGAALSDGSGRVDAEAVTAVGDAVYVGSERDNDNNKVSRPAVLRYQPSDEASELTATAEWNLAADFPGIGANAGIEGLTWIPDAWLTLAGSSMRHHGRRVRPARYPGHGDGLFFVGVEGTAAVYAYALAADGGFARIATIASPFPIVAEVQFSATASDRLRRCLRRTHRDLRDHRAVCRHIGRHIPQAHLYARPAQTANVANEGFALGEACLDGVAPTFYADDARTDGFSLRSGTIACTAASPPRTGSRPRPSHRHPLPRRCVADPRPDRRRDDAGPPAAPR